MKKKEGMKPQFCLVAKLLFVSKIGNPFLGKGWIFRGACTCLREGGKASPKVSSIYMYVPPQGRFWFSDSLVEGSFALYCFHSYIMAIWGP